MPKKFGLLYFLVENFNGLQVNKNYFQLNTVTSDLKIRTSKQKEDFFYYYTETFYEKTNKNASFYARRCFLYAYLGW